MKISHQELWNAVFLVLPKTKKASESGIKFNLPMTIRDAAIEIFIDNKKPHEISFEYLVAVDQIREALRELRSVGWMTFDQP